MLTTSGNAFQQARQWNVDGVNDGVRVASYKFSELNKKQLHDDLWSLILPTHPFNHNHGRLKPITLVQTLSLTMPPSAGDHPTGVWRQDCRSGRSYIASKESITHGSAKHIVQ